MKMAKRTRVNYWTSNGYVSFLLNNKKGKLETKEHIGLATGVFDILHIGHVRALQIARENCDYLIVGINSDASVKRLSYKHKMIDRPVIPQEERKELLEALSCVDEVVIFDEDTPVELIKHIKPHVFFKGEDWKGKKIPERQAFKKLKIVYLPTTKETSPTHSTTGIIEKIIKQYYEGR